MTYTETLTNNYKKLHDTLTEGTQKALEKSRELFEQASKRETWNELADKGRELGKELPEKTVKRFEELQGRIEPRVKEMQKKIEPTVKELGERFDRGAVSVFHRLGLPHAKDVAQLAQRVEELALRVDDLRSRVTAELTSIYTVRAAGDDWEVVTNDPKSSSMSFSTKKEAVSSARELARQHEPSRLVVQKKDGTVQDTFDYGEV